VSWVSADAPANENDVAGAGADAHADGVGVGSAALPRVPVPCRVPGGEADNERGGGEDGGAP
jgi:hypothetical protein